MALRRGLSLLRGVQSAGGVITSASTSSAPVVAASTATTHCRDTQLAQIFPWLSRGYKIDANKVRSGNVLEMDGKLYQVVKQEYTQGHGRQLGNVHLVMKDLMSGSQRLEKVRPSDSLEAVRLEEKQFSFLYREGDIFYLMDPETYEQINLDIEKLGDCVKYLEEDTAVKVAFYGDEPLSGSVANIVVVTVTEADPSFKGESTSSKGATAGAGFQLKVPLYIEKGEKILVDTTTGEFVRRAS